MASLVFWIVTLSALLGSIVLTGLTSSMRRIQRRLSKNELRILNKFSLYKYIHHYFLPEHELEGVFFAAISAQNICRFIFASGFTTLLILYLQLDPWGTILAVIAFILSFLLSDFVPRLLANYYPDASFSFFALFSIPFLILCFPINYFFIKTSKFFWKAVTYDYTHEPLAEAKQEIYEILQESDIENKLQPENKKIIEAVVTFQELIAREVMVPRVDLFALPSDISIRAAAKKIEAEGYSRIPVYRGTIDQVIGLLMYKDIISKYMESENKRDPHILDQPIETILKSVFYTPETKKISQLLQEFRRKQMHMAIVVDEYGGTEGIVTIEDILEQIVGRIEDEYDTEEDLFVTLADGNYIVDGRMSILHLEELLDIEIPEEGDYDTIGGYIFYKAGEIPTRGFTIKHDTFELEVLRASDRSIEKVKVIKKA